jgi:competence protein ComGC
MAVLLIVAVGVLVVLPLAAQTDAMQAQSAAQAIVAMLTYAQNYSITHGKPIQAVFNADGSVELQTEQGVVLSGNIRQHDLRYRIQLGLEKSFSKVRMVEVDFDGSRVLWFDALGAAYGGAIEENPPAMVSGRVTLQAGQEQMTIHIESVTGHIRVL